MSIKDDLGKALEPKADIWKIGAAFTKGDYELPVKTYFSYEPASKGRIDSRGLLEDPDYPETFTPELIEICGVEVKDPALQSAILNYLDEGDLIGEMEAKHREEKNK